VLVIHGMKRRPVPQAACTAPSIALIIALQLIKQVTREVQLQSSVATRQQICRVAAHLEAVLSRVVLRDVFAGVVDQHVQTVVLALECVGKVLHLPARPCMDLDVGTSTDRSQLWTWFIRPGHPVHQVTNECNHEQDKSPLAVVHNTARWKFLFRILRSPSNSSSSFLQTEVLNSSSPR